MASNFLKDDPIYGSKDLDDEYITDAWLVDQFVGNQLWGWGYNVYDQLGLNDSTSKSSPVQVGSLTDWKQVSVGKTHTASIKTDGTLWVFGSNYDGALGLGGSGVGFDRASPVQLGYTNVWNQVSVGLDFTAAIRSNGTLWAWGHNANGKLSILTSDWTNIDSNILIRASDKTFAYGDPDVQTYVTSSYDSYNSINIDSTGRLWAWGGNSTGALGLGNTTTYYSPAPVGTLTNWKQVAIGGGHTAAVKTNGTLWTWGWNGNGELGLNATTRSSSPVQVGSLTNWQQVSAGSRNCAAIKTDGTLWTWGYNGVGSLGQGDLVHRSSPTQVGSLTNWKQVSAGIAIGGAAAIKTDGTLWVWGYNIEGQLGLGDITHRSSPTQVGSLTNWKQVSAGQKHTAAIKTDGTLWAWGSNQYGGLGLNDQTRRSSPVQVGSLTNWKQVAVGADAVAAIKTDGTLWSWGYNNYGQLGLGDFTNRSSPVQVGSLTNWSQVRLGRTLTVVDTIGGLYTAGNGDTGQLGAYLSSAPLNLSSPVQVGTLTNWKQVTAGVAHTAAIKTDGTLWAWGSNSYGQLGLSDITHRSSAVQVGTLTNWKQVAVGGYNPDPVGSTSHTVAIKTDGTLWTWGGNLYGALGLGNPNSINRSSPVQVGSLTNWKLVSAGYAIAAAIKTDGTLWTWGQNTYGQLGLGNTTNRSSPVQVGTLTNWKLVACGQNHTAAIKTDGTLWVWGYNVEGQLGLDDITSYSSPVQVGSLTNWKQVSAGDEYALAITFNDIT